MSDDADLMFRGALTPGLIDVHNNGAFGVDFATADPVAWRAALAALAARGVTSVQPTLITAPLQALLKGLERVADALGETPGQPRARVLGAHLEGPFLSSARRGAHREDCLRDPLPEMLEALLRSPVLRTVTLAPERAGGMAAVQRFAGSGVLVSLGHSDADAKTAQAATDAGASAVTHLFNAMRPFTHRDPGLAGAALGAGRLWCCLIVDGLHVDPLVCRIAFAAAGDRLVAVSDSIALAGLPAGSTLPFGGAPATLGLDGLGRRADGTIAGAGIVLDEGVRRMIAIGVPSEAALYAATEAPARMLGRSDLGRIAPAALADLVWWDEQWRPRRVWVGGREVTIVG